MSLKLTVAEAQSRLSQLPGELTQDSHSDVALITDNGEPALVIVPWELYDGLLETLEILGDPEHVAALRQGIQDVAEGRTESWEIVKSNLRLSQRLSHSACHHQS
jgi:PHD/YefM family antitoxin component YafN of YafNO toxin-antitoxin module